MSVCAGVRASTRVFVRIRASVVVYGAARVDPSPEGPLPPFRGHPFPARSFSQTDGIWRGPGRGGSGRGDFVPEPLVWE